MDCLQYVCNETGLHIMVHGQDFRCYQEGQIIDLQVTSKEWLHTGSIVCPSCEEICQVVSALLCDSSSG